MVIYDKNLPADLMEMFFKADVQVGQAADIIYDTLQDIWGDPDMPDEVAAETLKMGLNLKKNTFYEALDGWLAAGECRTGWKHGVQYILPP